MPGFNGTGPASMGPMTGKGRGYCITEIDRVTYRGAGWNRGAGRGWRNCQYAAEGPSRGRQAPLYAFAPESGISEGGQEELKMLRERVKNLEAALERVTNRWDEGRVAD